MTNEIDELYAYNQKQQIRALKPAELPLFMQGFLQRFDLSARAAQMVTDGQAMVFVGLSDWWDRPGPPYVPYEDLTLMYTGRLQRLLQECFRAAHKRGELNEVCTATGDHRRQIIVSMRLED